MPPDTHKAYGASCRGSLPRRPVAKRRSCIRFLKHRLTTKRDRFNAASCRQGPQEHGATVVKLTLKVEVSAKLAIKLLALLYLFA